MGRKIAAGVAGVVVAFAVVALVEYIGHMVYPPPADIDTHDLEAMAQLVTELPMGAFLFVLAAWASGALAGSIVAGRIIGQPTVLYTIGVTGIVTLASIMNLIAIPHPTWFSISAIALLILAGVAAQKVLLQLED